MAAQEPGSEGPMKSSVDRLRRELDHWLDVAVSKGEQALDSLGIRPGKSWTPQVDVIETSDGVEVYIDVAGISPEGIDMSLVGNMLTIRGDKPGLARPEGTIVHRNERGSGPFVRAIPLPVAVDADSVDAEARNGTLRVTLQKTARGKARPITIRPETRTPDRPVGDGF